MLKAKISKEEVNEMPVVVFGGKITVVDDDKHIHDAVTFLRKHKIVGIDTETKPSFSRGQSHKVALLQISTEDHCFLFRLNKIKLSIELADFLADKKIKKIGLALKDDMVGLNKHHHFKPENLTDLQSVVKEYGILELGLQKIFAILFGKKISKSQRLTNWESHDLTEMQQRYAATDAWAVLKIYQQLSEEKKITRKQLEELIISHAVQHQRQDPIALENQTVNT
jgi:ribonuclease D